MARRIPLTLPLLLLAACAALLAHEGGPPAIAGNAPPNDNFANPVNVSAPLSPLGNDVISFSYQEPTAGATLEAGESAFCGAVGASVWFLYVAPASTTIEVDTAGSDFDTIVALYHIDDFAPSPPGGSLTPIACNNDDGASAQARLTGDVESNKVYAIQAGGVDGATGNLVISVGCASACPPANDDIAAAAPIESLPFTDGPATSAADLEAGEQTPCGGIDHTVWYVLRNFTPRPVEVEVNTAASTFATVLAVYRLDAAIAPSPPGSLSLVGCTTSSADDANRAGTTFSLEPFRSSLEPFDTVYVQAGGRDGASGVISVQFTCPEGACPLSPIVTPVDTGAGTPIAAPDAPGGVRPPETGSGGYLPRD